MSRLNMRTADLTGVVVKLPRYLYQRLKDQAAAANRAAEGPYRVKTVSRLLLEALDPDVAARYPFAGLARGETVALEHLPRRPRAAGKR